jgi:hypothetical protein
MPAIYLTQVNLSAVSEYVKIFHGKFWYHYVTHAHTLHKSKSVTLNIKDMKKVEVIIGISNK